MKIARACLLGCFVLLTVASASCGDEVCSGACAGPQVSIELKTPIAAQTLELTLDDGRGNPIASLHCQRDAGALSCSAIDPSGFAELVPQVDKQGALTSILARGSLSGSLEIVIVADGATVADQTFTYAPRPSDSACGCPLAGTLLIQN
jgi:hypothetical protein